MNPILTTLIAAFNTNTEVDSSSIRSMYDTMPMYESMIIDGDTITKELKRTPRGVFVRNLKNGDSIVHYGEGYDNRPSDVVSSQKWTRLPASEDLQTWLTEVDSLNSNGAYCGRNGSEQFTVYVGTAQTEFYSSSCVWDAQESFASVYTKDSSPTHSLQDTRVVAEHIEGENR